MHPLPVGHLPIRFVLARHRVTRALQADTAQTSRLPFYALVDTTALLAQLFLPDAQLALTASLAPQFLPAALVVHTVLLVQLPGIYVRLAPTVLPMLLPQFNAANRAYARLDHVFKLFVRLAMCAKVPH